MHIVIFTGGDAPEPELTRTYFSSRHPDYVIAADSGLITYEVYADFFSPLFKKSPDAILGDMDSLADRKKSEILKKYPAEVIQTFIEDKDYTDTELALEKAHDILRRRPAEKEESASTITLVGAGGGRRSDHFLAVFDLFSTDRRPDVWLAGEQTFWCALEGDQFEITGLDLHDMISLARTTASRTGGKVHSEGLLWEYDTFRPEGMPSISNRISPEYFEGKKPVRISVGEGRFLLILPTGVRVRLEHTSNQ